MKLRGPMTVVLLDGDHLSAVWGEVSREHVRIRGWLVSQRPTEVSTTDATAVGEWLRSTLRERGCRVAPTIFAIPRASVVLKRLVFPALAQASEGDLSGMVRLQLARQLTMPLQGAAIDYVRLAGVGAAPEGGGSREGIEVLAAALPGEQVSWCQGVAKAAGLKVRAVALRGEGSAAMFAQLSYTRGAPILGVSVTPQGVELGVVQDGRMTFSRAADLTPPSGVEEWNEFARRVAVEAKRTWTSYRSGPDAAQVELVAVLGDDALASTVGRAVGAELDIPWQAAKFPGAVDVPSDLDSSTRAGLSPLIGLLVGAAINRPTFDFANPRRAPDPAATARMLALASVLGLIVFVGGGYVAADFALADLRGEVASAKAQANSLLADYESHLRAQARLEHLGRHREAGTDWISHARWLTEQFPPSDQARLEVLEGVSKAAVVVRSRQGGEPARGKPMSECEWVIDREGRLHIAGKITSRTIATVFRGRLLVNPAYTVQPRGADLSDRFDYDLLTNRATPSASSKEGQP